MSDANTRGNTAEIYSIGDTVISTRSWSRLVIAKVDSVNRMYVDKHQRAVSFDECFRV